MQKYCNGQLFQILSAFGLFWFCTVRADERRNRSHIHARGISFIASDCTSSFSFFASSFYGVKSGVRTCLHILLFDLFGSFRMFRLIWIVSNILSRSDNASMGLGVVVVCCRLFMSDVKGLCCVKHLFRGHMNRRCLEKVVWRIILFWYFLISSFSWMTCFVAKIVLDVQSSIWVSGIRVFCLAGRFVVFVWNV